jgi:hypothetical protein
MLAFIQRAANEFSCDGGARRMNFIVQCDFVAFRHSRNLEVFRRCTIMAATGD